MTCFSLPGTGMPHLKLVREMERSFRAPGTYGLPAAEWAMVLSAESCVALGEIQGSFDSAASPPSLRMTAFNISAALLFHSAAMLSSPGATAFGPLAGLLFDAAAMLPRRKLRTSFLLDSGWMRSWSLSMRLMRGSW